MFAGNIYLLAGRPGQSGYTNGSRPALSAYFGQPASTASDAQGNIYIVDFANLYKLTANYTTVQHLGSYEYGTLAGVAVLANGTILLSRGSKHTVCRYDGPTSCPTVVGSATPGYTGDGGPASGAALRIPRGIAAHPTDPNKYYIADSDNDVVRMVSNGIITTVAGSWSDSYSYYSSSTFSGDGGPANIADLNMPLDVAVDAAGNLFIADSSNNRIRCVAGVGRG
jgi:hypothetical protein